MGDDWLDDALGIGCMFDWITPLAGVIETVIRGGGVNVTVDGGSCFGRNEVRTVLRKARIDYWGMMYTLSGDISFMVRREDEAAAEQAFQRWSGYEDDWGLILDLVAIGLGVMVGIAGYLWWVGVI